MLTNKMLQR